MQEQAARIGDPRNEASKLGRQLNLPPAYLLIHRVTIGSIGVLCQLDSAGDFRASGAVAARLHRHRTADLRPGVRSGVQARLQVAEAPARSVRAQRRRPLLLGGARAVRARRGGAAGGPTSRRRPRPAAPVRPQPCADRGSGVTPRSVPPGPAREDGRAGPDAPGASGPALPPAARPRVAGAARRQRTAALARAARRVARSARRATGGRCSRRARAAASASAGVADATRAGF